MAEKNEKKYVSDSAQLLAEWNWEKNASLDPAQLTLGSNKKVWWACSKGHEWMATPNNRSNGSGCPYCASRKVLKGYNDLQTVNPVLAAEWNYKKSDSLSPADVTSNSDKIAWWKCSKGHEWQATVGSRNRGAGCPYCAGQKVIRGYNDLETVNPSLAKEWNYDKNCTLMPADVMPSSYKKVWWKCQRGHEWQAAIGNRNKGAGCPYCAGQKPLKGKNDLETINPALAKEWNYEKNNGLLPSDFMPNSGKKVWWRCQKGHQWQARIAHRNNGIGCPECDMERHTSFPEYALMYYLEKSGIDAIHLYRENDYELDIFIPSKNIAIEYDGYFWHNNKTKKDLEKNRRCVEDGIKLYRVREYLPSLYDSSIDFLLQKDDLLDDLLTEILFVITKENVDVNLKRDAIYIENLREFNEKESSLLCSNPQISAEWNYMKNGKLRPENYTVSSSKRVWWKCSEGHEWEAKISQRNNGTGCPYCAGKKVLKGYNDLKTINPSLAKEWNYKKNVGLTPEDVSSNSNKKIWWICTEDHEWETTVNNRKKGTGCPYCSGRYAIEGTNDLQTVNPDLAGEWNYEKNEGLFPSKIKPNSNKKIWWKCVKGHEWQATVAHRNNGRGCPYCSGRRMVDKS